MRVLFLENVATKEAKPQRFVAGEVYDLPEDSAQHWLTRGKAEAVDEKEDAKETKPLAAAELSPEVRKHQAALKAKKEAKEAEEPAKPSEEFSKGKPDTKGDAARAPILKPGESVVTK